MSEATARLTAAVQRVNDPSGRYTDVIVKIDDLREELAERIQLMELVRQARMMLNPMGCIDWFAQASKLLEGKDPKAVADKLMEDALHGKLRKPTP